MTSETIVDLPSGHVLKVYQYTDGEWSVVLEDPEGSRKEGTWVALAGGPVKSHVLNEAAAVLAETFHALALVGERTRTPSPQPSDGARGATRPTCKA